MVCPICVATAIVANAPAIAAGVAGAAAAAQGGKKVVQMRKEKKALLVAKNLKATVPAPPAVQISQE